MNFYQLFDTKVPTLPSTYGTCFLSRELYVVKKFALSALVVTADFVKSQVRISGFILDKRVKQRTSSCVVLKSALYTVVSLN